MIMSKKKLEYAVIAKFMWCQPHVRAVNQFSFTPGIFLHMNKPQIKTVTKRVSSKEL